MGHHGAIRIYYGLMNLNRMHDDHQKNWTDCPINQRWKYRDKKRGPFQVPGPLVVQSIKFHKHLILLQSKLSSIRGVSFRLRKYLNLNVANDIYFIHCWLPHHCFGVLLRCTANGDLLKWVHRKLVVIYSDGLIVVQNATTYSYKKIRPLEMKNKIFILVIASPSVSMSSDGAHEIQVSNYISKEWSTRGVHNFGYRRPIRESYW